VARTHGASRATGSDGGRKFGELYIDVGPPFEKVRARVRQNETPAPQTLAAAIARAGAEGVLDRLITRNALHTNRSALAATSSSESVRSASPE
jgi:hypothetical protein